MLWAVRCGRAYRGGLGYDHRQQVAVASALGLLGPAQLLAPAEELTDMCTGRWSIPEVTASGSRQAVTSPAFSSRDRARPS